MKVLHITEGFDGGVVTFLRHVLPAQRARGLDVLLLCSPRHEEDQQGDLDCLDRHGVRVRLVRMGRGPSPIRDATAITAMVRLLRKEKPAIVHTHCFKAGLLGRIAARIVGGMVVVHTPHCFPFMRSDLRFMARLCEVSERVLAHWTRCLVVVSESQRQAAFEAAIDARVPCEVIPNGLAPPAYADGFDRIALKQQLGLPGDAPVAGTMCRLVDYKCVDDFVRAAEIVQRRIPKAMFLIVGDGPCQEHLVRLAGRLGLDDSICFTGQRSDAGQLLRLMDVCVLCSRAEGMPYTLLEAMMANIPVVASSVPGNADVIQDGRTGLLYEFGRVDRLADAMVRCLTDDALRTRLADEAKHHVILNHRLDEQIDSLVGLYRRLTCSADSRVEPAARNARLRMPSAVEGERCL